MHQEEELRTTKRKLDKVNWDTFQAVSKERCEVLHGDDRIDGDMFIKMTVEVIIQSAKETIPKSAGSRGKKSAPWWGENCR